MVSVYGYITLADLENFTGLDYSTINSVAFSDAKVEFKITLAERMINAYLGVSSGQTKTDAIIVCALTISASLVHMNLQMLGFNTPASDMFIVNNYMTLAYYLRGESLVSVDAIPMSGADR